MRINLLFMIADWWISPPGGGFEQNALVALQAESPSY
jgi:hypothetical protein